MKKQAEIEADFEVNFKKMDNHDFVFVNKPLTPKEDKEFSEFLKSRKTKAKAKRSSKPADSPKI